MLKAIVFVVVAVVFGIVSVQAQAPTAPDSKFTATMPNGRFWLALTEQEKQIWLIAYADGIKTCGSIC
jgi:hypothetical protein